VVGKLKLVGLTGSIGSGKSTVARIIEGLGVPVIDADRLAREVVAPGEPAYVEIAATWPDVVQPDGQLDRRRLAARVFSDRAARGRLESITHPRIQERALHAARALEAQGHRLAFYEASLLVETGRYKDFDGLVVVTADEEQQIARTVARDRSSPEQARARLEAQLPLAEKRRAATHIVDNSGDLETTRKQVEGLVAELRRDASGTGPPGLT
jgi:dephospho-CoA kinase